MNRFHYAMHVVLGHEGDVVNDPDDRGGLTNAGVTTKTYNAYRRRLQLPLRPVTDIEPHEVEAIYHEYWHDAHCDRLPNGLDLVVFDMAINSGPSVAIKTLQKILGVDVDGIFGPQTNAAIREEILIGGLAELIEQYIAARADFYHALVAKDRAQKKFIGGWIARLDHLREVVA